jgi:hypothetical protein
VGETQERPFQLSFNSSLSVEFQGALVSSDGGLLIARELDERLGLANSSDGTRPIPAEAKYPVCLWPTYCGNQCTVHWRGMRMSTTLRAFAGSDLPAHRVQEDLGAWGSVTSRLQSFETEVLTQATNLAGLAALNRIARAEAINARLLPCAAAQITRNRGAPSCRRSAA